MPGNQIFVICLVKETELKSMNGIETFLGAGTEAIKEHCFLVPLTATKIKETIKAENRRRMPNFIPYSSANRNLTNDFRNTIRIPLQRAPMGA